MKQPEANGVMSQPEMNMIDEATLDGNWVPDSPCPR
jgi:hypothetical protein